MKVCLHYGDICLEAHFVDGFKDQFHPELGHYTVPDEVYIEAVYHQGVDIYDLLCEGVIDDIYKAYNAQCEILRLEGVDCE